MIRACQVVVRRRSRPVLTQVNVEVRPGELVVVVGPNGAGKSTLLSVLAGDIRPDEGFVEVAGKRLGELRRVELARHRAVLPQQSTFGFPFRVREVVSMGRAPWRGTPAEGEDAAAVARALAATELEELRDVPVTQLSGGERARVAFARVLAQEAPVVLLDEPTASLDLRHQELTLGLAHTLAREGRAVLAVLHDLSLAAAYADRVVMFSDGAVAADGPPAEALVAERILEVYGHGVHVVDRPDGRRLIVPWRLT